jgi:hypothetical protein
LSLFLGLLVYGQKDSLTRAERKALDSMLKNDDFLNLIKEKPASTFDISVGLGNGSFSSHNNAANATGITNQVIFTPAVFYHHKSGLSIGATTYITSDSISSGIYQTGITGSYDYTGKLISGGISYTRYLSDLSKYNSKCIYQNDIFGYAKLSKGVIQPVINLGYANGKYKEINYQAVKVLINRPPPKPDTLVTVKIKDSTNNTTSYFSFSGGIEHDFYFYNLLSGKDEFDITPALFVNAATDQLSTTHTNKIFDKYPRLTRRKKFGSGSNKFQLQSVAMSLDMTYSIGKFFVQPGLYLDYYLPSTTSKRLTAVYSFVVGVSF